MRLATTTFSKTAGNEANADAVITVLSGTTVSKLMLAGEEVPKNNSANWSYSQVNNTVTLKKAYLAALETGTHTFTIKYSGGDDATFDIVVIA